MATFDDDQFSQTTLPQASRALALKNRIRYLAIPALTWETLVWAGLVVSAFLTRFWNLGARVMSHDESEHAYFSWLLSKGGGYAHNPMMHGSSLFEITAFFQAIFTASDFTTRLAPALIGITIVIVVPILMRPWLGRLGALFTSLFFLISPYVLYYSRYDRHDIYEIAWALLATFAIFGFLRARARQDKIPAGEDHDVPAEENRQEDEVLVPFATDEQVRFAGEEPFPAEDENNSLSGESAPPAALRDQSKAQRRGAADGWLMLLAVAVGLMFSTMETAFFYLAIFASFLVLRLLLNNGLNWEKIRRAAEFDVLIVLGTLGAFFSSQIALLILNPIWTKITGQPFVPLDTLSSFGTEWANGPYGLRIWGLMIVFWWLSAVVGIFWDWRRWIKLAGIFLAITITMFTTFFTNWSGIGTGFVGSLGYWISQQGVQRGSQPWYYYFIVFPIYEYLPIVGGLAAIIYFAVRRRLFSEQTRGFILHVAWWSALIFTGLTLAGEKMPWLSTHITAPLILLSGWFVGQVAERGWGREVEQQRLSNLVASATLVIFAALVLLTARTSYLVNYVNYDSVTEFIDYAHGAPGVKWLISDADKIGAAVGQENTLPIAFDSANSWPLTWYLRNRTGFYGDQPDRATLLNTLVVVAGPQNWDKVERYLGPDYHRYEVNRIWWPMEDYKNLTWDRIKGALFNPQMRQAVWNIIWSRDYRLYAQITGENLDPPAQWPLQDRMRIYIRKDAAAKVPNLMLQSSQIADIKATPDPYAAKKVSLSPVKMLQPGDLNGPRNLAVAKDGSVYVVDTGNSRIVHLDTEGKALGSWGSRTPDNQTPPAQGTFNEPWGIAVDAQGNVYVADTWNHRIQKFDPQGKFLLQWGTGGLSSEGNERFWGPRGIAIAPDGNVYVTDTGNRRVAVFDPQGKFLFAFSQGGAETLNEPVGIAIDAQGQVFVADTWNMRVVIFDSKGNYVKSWPVQSWNSTSIDEKPFLALDSQGRVYLSDPEAGRVLVFDQNGIPLAAFGQLGSDNTSFDLPTGIQIDAQGNVWIADASNNRLAVYPQPK